MARGFEPAVPAGWTNVHRAFLQALLSRGTLTFREAQPIMAAIFSAGSDGPARSAASIDERQFRTIMHKLREAVAPLDYDLRSTTHQTTREPIWALINAHSDPATQLATSRTPDEIAFIKRVLDAMFETYNTQRLEVMAVTAAQARQCARPAKREQNNADGEDDEEEAPRQTQVKDRGLKHSDIEKLLPSMVDEGWFEQSDEGFYSLSARTLLELKTWLNEAYNDPDAGPEAWQRIKFCAACRDIVTVGQRCPERDCNVRLHDTCADAFWRTRRAGQFCPKCETAWTGTNYVGERAVTETAAAQRRRPKASRRSNGNRSVVNDGVDGDGAEEEEEVVD